MTRALLSLVLAACTSNITGGQAGPQPDADLATAPHDGAASTNDAGSAASLYPCKNMTTPSGNGHHNPGQDCTNSCHNHGFTVAGTLYAAGGTTAVAGATITVKDANGALVDLISQQNGNFYTTQAVAFPIAVYASACPTSVPMVSTVASGNGGCNKSGCHASGAQGHVHL